MITAITPTQTRIERETELAWAERELELQRQFEAAIDVAQDQIEADGLIWTEETDIVACQAYLLNGLRGAALIEHVREFAEFPRSHEHGLAA
ncbi:hypothetical protein [Microbacterium sp. NPDC055683]